MLRFESNIVNKLDMIMFDRLPEDTLLYINSFLPLDALSALSRTSKMHHTLFSRPVLWQQLTARDFYSNTAQKNSFEDYKQLQLAIPKEKKRFLCYVILCIHIEIDIEKRKQNGEFLGIFPNPPPEQHKAAIEAVQEDIKNDHLRCAFRELDLQAAKSNKHFEDYYNKMTESTPKEHLTSMEITAQQVLLDCLINAKKMTTDRKELIEPISSAYYQPVCLMLDLSQKKYVAFLQYLSALDASAYAKIALNYIELAPQSRLSECVFIQAFSFPCLNVIRLLLNTGMDINIKAWIRWEGRDPLHITPLAAAILCMYEQKNIRVSHDIISLLLDRGADPSITVLVTDFDVDTESMYKRESRSIIDLCKLRLEWGLERDADQEEEQIFIDTMNMVINHHKSNRLGVS